MNFWDLSKYLNSPAIKEIQKMQNTFSKFDKSLPKTISQLSEIVNSPAAKIFQQQQTLWNSVLPPENLMKAVEPLSYAKQILPNSNLFQNQLSEIQDILKPSLSFFSAISTNNFLFSAFNNSGVFKAISDISKIMTGYNAVNRLNSIIPYFEQSDYDVNISDDGTISLDDEVLTENEIRNIAQIFISIQIGEINKPSFIDKLKSKTGSFFFGILKLILCYLFLYPVLDKFFPAVRDNLGITKVIEQIDIETWVNERLFNNTNLKGVKQMETTQTIELPSMVVIIANLSTVLTLSHELDDTIFRMGGIPYFPPLSSKEIEAMEKIKVYAYEKINEAIEQNYSIIIMDDSPLTFEIMQEIYEKTDKPNASGWLVLSFFHGDTELLDNKVQVTQTEYLEPQILLDIKSKDMEKLSDYPFIKKVFIPHGFTVTADYLKTLFDKNE
jgi:hypothetical protein